MAGRLVRVHGAGRHAVRQCVLDPAALTGEFSAAQSRQGLEAPDLATVL